MKQYIQNFILTGRSSKILKDFPDGIIAIDINTRKIVEINNSATALLGYEKSELIGKDVLIFHPVAYKEKVKNLIFGLKIKNVPYLLDIPFIRKNGEIVFVDITSTKLWCNGNHIVLGFLRDRKKIINKFTGWNLLYEQLAEMIGCGVCIISNKRFVYINKNFVDLLGGKAPVEFIEKDAFNIIPEPERKSAQCLYENLMSGTIPIVVEKQRIKRLDGEEIEVFVKAVRITYNGEVSAHCVVLPASLTLKESFVNSSNQSDSQKLISTLTKREIEILCLLAGSYTIKEIANKLKIAYHTVMSHKHSIMKKLHFKSLADLTLFAIKNGMVKTE